MTPEDGVLMMCHAESVDEAADADRKENMAACRSGLASTSGDEQKAFVKNMAAQYRHRWLELIELLHTPC